MEDLAGKTEVAKDVKKDEKSYQKQLPYVEAYRPSTLKDVVGNKSFILRLLSLVNQGLPNHLCLTGPSGIGKTTSILCFGKALLGPLYQEALLELNASDERGIAVVTGLISTFAQKKVTFEQEQQHKIVLLDEADSMVPGAQQKLLPLLKSKTITRTTRFVITANQREKLIPSLLTHFMHIELEPISSSDTLLCLESILRKERKCDFTESGLNAITDIARGDLRIAIQTLQACIIDGRLIDDALVYNLLKRPAQSILQEFLKACMGDQYLVSAQLLTHLREQGYAPKDVLKTIELCIARWNVLEFPIKQKTALFRKIAETSITMSQGCRSYLQLFGLAAEFCLYFR